MKNKYVTDCVSENGKDLINGMKEGIKQTIGKLTGMSPLESIPSILHTATGKLTGGDMKMLTGAAGKSVGNVLKV
ncbi:hypothetical protein TNCT_368321 [Trichonephila clavata]|uniref:Uncharacterized protein n=1 Tax=Trichonephila clavata TaxID=2740835 RepID=A0A8X6LEQ5_TRICU|nr:hypothetical protein TNCT_368321 [Trichonephila clavata]